MSFLYDKRTKKAIKWIWVTFAALIVISMIFAYSGGSSLFRWTCLAKLVKFFSTVLLYWHY